MSDIIARPAHYTEGKTFEPKDVVSSLDLNFFMGNVVKYISRAGRKAGSSYVEDLKKARQYAEFEYYRLDAKEMEIFDKRSTNALTVSEDWKIGPRLANVLSLISEEYVLNAELAPVLRKKWAVKRAMQEMEKEIKDVES